jgi:hypothetical protein
MRQDAGCVVAHLKRIGFNQSSSKGLHDKTLTSIPSLVEYNKSENTVMNSEVISCGLSSSTSATLPKRPIILRSNSGWLGKAWKLQKKKEWQVEIWFFKRKYTVQLTLRQLRKNCMPLCLKKRLQLRAVSSVTFHIVDHATSITSSQTLRLSFSSISCSMVWNNQISSINFSSLNNDI